MDAKLTLKLNKSVIEKAKKYAASSNRSLSRIIESYLKSLINRDLAYKKVGIKISPFVKSISTGVKMPSDIDYKTEYVNYLAQKYK